MRSHYSRHNMLRSVIRRSATVLFCALAALGFMRCAEPVGPITSGASEMMPRFFHTGEADYTVSAIPFSADPTPTTTNADLKEDDWTTGLIPIGFDFEFFGTSYSSINISTNGVVGFDASMGDGCCEGGPIPANDAVNNMIAVLWSDLTPDATGQIWFGMSGTAPNRRFIVHYKNVSFWPRNEADRIDVQLKLFEGTNVIEIHSLTVPVDGHVHTQGIENATGTDAYFVPGRVAASFVLSNDAVRFTPAGDKTPPVVAAELTGDVGNDGWFTSNVGLSWTVTDDESPISATSGCGPVTVTTDQQATTYTCSATSGGGTTTESVSIKRDATNPIVAFSGNAGAYTVDQFVAITCDASDATSGLASSDCEDVSGDAYTFGLGSSSFSASATDKAGNSSAITASFVVSVTPGSLCNLVRRWVSQKGIANSLCRQLAGGAYDAFRNQVRSQSGKQIPADKAEILIQLSHGL
ncbi:MAG TPA: hypothetical protein VMO26_25525 [Vicinamibacterales bacterium]|nr:hypothetical protein [Vicinamibacterales bacterium]